MRRLFTACLFFIPVFAYCQKADTSEVYFELNIAKVGTVASMTLDSLWFTKAIAPGKKTILLGFGDYLGTDEYNRRLSQERAQNVKDYLVALGLNEKDIALCKGKGRIMHNPAPGEIGIIKDRKVQIIVSTLSNRKTVKPAPLTGADNGQDPAHTANKVVVKTKPESKPKPLPKPEPVQAPQPTRSADQKTSPASVPTPAPIVTPPPPVAAKPSGPKAPPVLPQPTTAPPLNRNAEIKRKPEKDLATLDPAKLQVGETIPLNNIFFAPGSNAMLRKSEPALDELYKFMNDNPDIYIEIQGHICCLDPADGTDEPDGLGGNRSEGRAKNIYIYLISKGLDKNRMRYVGLGNKKPAVFPEKTEYDRELNRRSTILILAK